MKFKYVVLTLALGLGISLQSCKEADPEPEPQITGVWTFDSAAITDGVIYMSSTPAATYSATTSNEVGTVDFNANGNLTMNVGYDLNMVITTFAGTQTQTSNVPQAASDPTPYTYDKVGNTVTLTEDSATTVFQVLELTDNNLKLLSINDETTIENGQKNGSYHKYHLYLSRQ